MSAQAGREAISPLQLANIHDIAGTVAGLGWSLDWAIHAGPLKAVNRRAEGLLSGQERVEMAAPHGTLVMPAVPSALLRRSSAALRPHQQARACGDASATPESDVTNHVMRVLIRAFSDLGGMLSPTVPATRFGNIPL